MKADTEALLDPPTLTPEENEPPDLNVWMLPPEIVEAIERERAPHEDRFEALWRFCFGEPAEELDRRNVKRAIFAGRASGSVLLIRRAP